MLIGVDPHTAVMIGGDSPNRMRSNPGARTDRGEVPLVIANDIVVFTGKPEITTCSGDHRNKPAGADARRVALIEDVEPDAVKLGNAVQRRHPNVPIWRLHDTPDAVLRKPCVGSPLRGTKLCVQAHGCDEHEQRAETMGTEPQAPVINSSAMWKLKHV